MRRSAIVSITALLLLAVLGSAVRAKSAAELLREGLYAEEVEGNLDAAIGIYQQIILDAASPRNLVAQALYRQGTAFMKKKQEADARAVFQKLVDDYSDQADIVARVRPMLEELGNADPASLMPPQTIVYVEIGSPGRQIETVLKMLEGTPLENPLAAIPGSRGQIRGGLQNPANIVATLLNPSMMAEFKKIRGMGIGLIDVRQDNPPAVVVLFPGKSDVLRGLLTAGLGMLGQPSEPIEGMQTLQFSHGGAVAYDETVVIFANANEIEKGRELLRWSVRQYKGTAAEPSLASGNRSFTKISKRARQENAVTFWLNVGETYRKVAKLAGNGELPPQLQMINGMGNLEGVQDVIASLSLRETGIAIEANANFKDGYQSMAYSLIRTPHLDKAALKAIPAEAIGLISLTLSDAGTPQAQAASEKIRSAIGQDLGSKIFGNVKQIALFALPAQETATPGMSDIPAFVQSFSLAITSKDPPQVQQALTTFLQAAQMLSADAESIPASGRFNLSLANGISLSGYTDPASKTMLLSLNPQVVEASVTAMRQNESVISSGKLQDALDTLSPQTSKLILVNVAGALELVAKNIEFPSDEARQQARQALDKLTTATQKTTLRLQTSEETDSFGIRLSVSDLPPLGEVFEPMVQLAQMAEQAKTQMAVTEAKAQQSILILETERAPAIDGKIDELWIDVPSHPIQHLAYSATASEADLAANFRTVYNRQALYVLVDVTDDQMVNDSPEFWLDDGVEIFIDADNSKDQAYGENDYQYWFSWDAASPTMGETHHQQTDGVAYAFARTDNGYRFEVKLPWSTLGTEPTAGQRIGLDVHVNDDDDGGDRDTKRMWYADNDISWENPSAFGNAELAGLVAWWKLDETGGRTAADSSGNGYDATVQGNPDWRPTAGRVGGAIALGGDGDFLDVADESAFDLTAGVTVAAWIKADVLDKPWQAIVTKGEWAWRLQRNQETSTIEFACSHVQIPDRDSPYGFLYGTREISLGEWHHVAGTYDGRRMAVYMDGTLDTAQAASGPIGVDDDPVMIGANAAQGDRFWNGMIDDVRIYNYGLTEGQVRELFNQGR